MIRTSNEDGTSTVFLEGNIGIEDMESLQRILEGSASAGGDVAVDLASCRALSSSAIGAMIACHNTLRGRGGRLRIKGPNDDMKRLLKMMGLDRHFELA